MNMLGYVLGYCIGVLLLLSPLVALLLLLAGYYDWTADEVFMVAQAFAAGAVVGGVITLAWTDLRSRG